MHALEKETNLLQSGPLRIGFHWHRDRFAHSISLDKEGRWLPLLASREGDGELRWPPSPPLQELHFEERPTGRVALLVGSTSDAHWSLAIDTTEAGFCFDVACRISGGEVFDSSVTLQTAYRSMVAPKQESKPSGAIGVDAIQILPLDHSARCGAEEGGKEDPAWHLTIVPEWCEGVRKTVCWRYAVNFSSADVTL